MLRHFVGRVFLLNEPPDDELPFIDIPAWSVPDDIPLTLSLEMSPSRLSSKTIEQLKLLHAQNYLDVSVIQKNVSIPAEFQINAAKEITDNISKYRNLLCWNRFPDAKKFDTISYIDILNLGLHVMDSTATSLCMDNHIPLVVFNIDDYDNIYRAAIGEIIGTTVK